MQPDDAGAGIVARTLHHPALVAGVLLLSVTGAGGHLVTHPLGADDVAAIVDTAMLGADEIAAVVTAAIVSDRETRLAGQEGRLQFVHRVDVEHEECVTAPGGAGDDAPRWARALVEEMRWLRCDTRRSHELLMRLVE